MKIQKEDWLSPKIDILDSSISGKGMFANVDIKEGEKLIIWGGDYTDAKGANEAEKAGKLVMQWDENLFSVENRGEEKVTLSTTPVIPMLGCWMPSH